MLIMCNNIIMKLLGLDESLNIFEAELNHEVLVIVFTCSLEYLMLIDQKWNSITFLNNNGMKGNTV